MSEAYPTSLAQQRLWFVEQLVPDTGQHNLVSCFRVHGAINSETLGRALDAVAARHESLRTSFGTVDGTPVQVVAPAVEIPLDSDSVGDARAAVTTFAGEPFDLSRPPLCRVGLFRDEDQTLLAIVLHHLVADGWSLGIFADELAAHYSALAREAAPALPPLPLQYVDFALWQRESTSAAEFEQRLAAYAEELAGAPHLLELPYDRTRPAIQSFAGAAIDFEIPVDLLHRLKEIARLHGATPYMALLSAYFLVLSRWTGQRDLLVATPIAGREDSRLEHLIGFFVDNVVLRGDLTGDPTLGHLLERVADRCLTTFSGSPVPFDHLVGRLAPERGLAHNPLVQVMFALQNTPESRPSLADARLEPFRPDVTSSPFDLAMDLTPTDGAWVGRLFYATDLFDTVTARRFVGHFVNAVRAIADEPDQRFAGIDILDHTERTELSDRGAGPVPISDPPPLPRWIRETALKMPDRTATVDDEGAWTYRELLTYAEAVSAMLRREGIGHEDLVAVCLPRDRFMLGALLGVWLAGAAFVPLDPGYPRARLEFMMSDIDSPLLLTTHELAARLPASPTTAVRYLERVVPADLGGPVRPFGTELCDLAYAIYTSGSTGRPKGVLIEHRGIANQIEAFVRALAFTGSDRMLAMTSMSFDPFLVELFVPLVTGGVVEVVGSGLAGDPERLDAALRERAVTVAQATPSTWTLYCEQVGSAPPSLRQVLTGGEELSDALASRLLELGVVVHNVYGPTETTVWTTRAQVDDPTAITVGRPIERTRLSVMDSDGQLAPPGVPGELWIAGAGVARGFLNRPELTARKFVRAPDGARAYRSGDLACWNADGSLRFLGRIDQQVKVRGHRIELGEVDATMRRHADIRDSLTAVHTDPSGQQTLITAVVPARDDQPEGLGQEAKRWARLELPDHMTPTTLLVLESLPRTPSGKGDRKAVEELAVQRSSASGTTERPTLEHAGTEPVDEMRQRLHDLWCEVLHRPAVSVTDNIFDFGATSLSTVRVRQKLRDRHGVQAPLTAFFAYPTIAALATQLADGEAGGSATRPGRRATRRSMDPTASRRRAGRRQGER